MKYEYAKKYFEQKKYARAYTLLGELVTIYKGTDKAEESLYLLARGERLFNIGAVFYNILYKLS